MKKRKLDSFTPVPDPNITTNDSDCNNNSDTNSSWDSEINSGNSDNSSHGDGNNNSGNGDNQSGVYFNINGDNTENNTNSGENGSNSNGETNSNSGCSITSNNSGICNGGNSNNNCINIGDKGYSSVSNRKWGKGMLPLGFDFGFNNPKFSNYVLLIKDEEERDESGMLSCSGGSNNGSSSKANKNSGNNKRKIEVDKTVRLFVNSLLLSAHSDFFKSLFTHDMLESRASEVSVYVADDEISLLEDIIRFVYLGVFQTPPEDMIHLLFVADKFLFTKVADDIVEHHKSSLTVEQCIQYLDLNEALQASTFEKLYHHVRLHLAKEFRVFDQVWNTDRFLDLPVRALTAVIESDLLILQSENTILSGLLAWINVDPPTREKELKDLIKHIRFGHMDPSFLVDVVQRIEAITSHPEFMSIYKKVQVYKSQKMEIRSLEPFMMPRIYTDKGSSRFSYDFRQITRMDVAHPSHSDKFYWRGYYLYLSAQKVDNKLEISVHVDQEKSGIPPEQPITLKHESTLDLKNYDTGHYDHIAKNFTSYYSRGSVTLFCIDWDQFVNPRCAYQPSTDITGAVQLHPTRYVDLEDVLSVSLKVKLRSRGMCRLCGSLAYQLCGRCRGIYYCSKECQKLHWKDHKKDCRPAEPLDGAGIVGGGVGFGIAM